MDKQSHIQLFTSRSDHQTGSTLSVSYLRAHALHKPLNTELRPSTLVESESIRCFGDSERQRAASVFYLSEFYSRLDF